jgi:DNA-binding NarL/FixJ family response regulator
MPKQPKKRERQAVFPGFELPSWQGGADATRVPAGKSRTSIAAAEAIADMAPTLRGKVYREIVRRGDQGATRAEIAEQLAIRESTVCGRCRELLDLGLIYDTGTTRQTTSGRAAVVMRAK